MDKTPSGSGSGNGGVGPDKTPSGAGSGNGGVRSDKTPSGSGRDNGGGSALEDPFGLGQLNWWSTVKDTLSKVVKLMMFFWPWNFKFRTLMKTSECPFQCKHWEDTHTDKPRGIEKLILVASVVLLHYTV